MKYILYIHAALESIAGFLLLFNPEWLLMSYEPNLQGVVVSKLYGIAAFTMGIITYLLSQEFQYTAMYKKIILCIIAFHCAVGLFFYGVYQQQVTPNMGASALHLTIAVLSMLLYLRDFQKFQDAQHIDK
jgi:hypothetical protein